MSDNSTKSDKNVWAIGSGIGGGAVLGVGVGFFFLQQSIFYFIGCSVAGVGVGLILAALLSKIKH